MTEISAFDERLAEIDRRLRTIQSDLAPVADPPPPVRLRAAPDPAPPVARTSAVGPSADQPPAETQPPDPPSPGLEPSEPTASLIAQLRELQVANERLLELHRELLSQYAELLERRAGADAEGVAATLTAGPFGHAEAVRAFEHALGALPGVSGVAVREYLAGDRVAIDVRLSPR